MWSKVNYMGTLSIIRHTGLFLIEEMRKSDKITRKVMINFKVFS